MSKGPRTRGQQAEDCGILNHASHARRIHGAHKPDCYSWLACLEMNLTKKRRTSLKLWMRMVMAMSGRMRMKMEMKMRSMGMGLSMSLRVSMRKPRLRAVSAVRV